MDSFLIALGPAIAAAVAGHWLGARRPRRQVFTTTMSARRSLIPDGARPEPGDDYCVRDDHQRLTWTEKIERLRGGVTMRWLIEAHCGDCGRPQTSIRLVYPPDRILEVDPPQQPNPDDPGPSDQTASAGPGDPALDDPGGQRCGPDAPSTASALAHRGGDGS